MSSRNNKDKSKRPADCMDISPEKDNTSNKKANMGLPQQDKNKGGKGEGKGENRSEGKGAISVSEKKLEELFTEWGTKLQLSINNTEAMVKRVESTLKTDLSKVQETQKQHSTELQGIRDSLNDNEGRFKDIEESVTECKNDIQTLAEDYEALKLDNEKLKKRVISQEDYSRVNNLKFYNVPDKEKETREETLTKLRDIIEAIGITDGMYLDIAHRMNEGNTTP